MIVIRIVYIFSISVSDLSLFFERDFRCSSSLCIFLLSAFGNSDCSQLSRVAMGSISTSEPVFYPWRHVPLAVFEQHLYNSERIKISNFG